MRHSYIMKEILIIERIVTHTIPQTYVFNIFAVGIFLRGENTPLWEGSLHYEKCVFLRSKSTRSKRLRCCERTAEEVLCKGDTVHLSPTHGVSPCAQVTHMFLQRIFSLLAKISLCEK